MKNYRRMQFLVRYLCVPSLLLALLLPVLTLAQGADAVVRFEPAAAEVGVGETVTVDIVVEQVADLFGVEVHLTFDPSVVEAVDADPGMAGVQVGLGPFLDVGFVAVNEVNQGTGHIDFAYSAMPPSGPVSGSGVLATITFRGLAPGVSPLTFAQVILANFDANPIPHSTQNGQVSVPGGETPTPTSTSTPTPTAEGTSTPTPTATPTLPPGAVLTFNPQTAFVDVGGTVEIKLQVTGASNLYGVEVHLTHGGGIDAVSITAGPCVADIVAQASVEGNQVNYAASLQAPSPPVNGTCDLATITISGLAAGTHSLQFTSALLSDPDGNPLSVTTQDGTVVVGGPTVTPTPTPPPDCGDILGYHVVQPRETLYSIGRAYGVQPYAIASCNGIVNPSLIYVGTRLAIPNIPWFPIPPGPVARRQFGDGVPPSCRFYHTVQWGETLFRISLQYGVSMWAIAEANSIYNLHYIQAGQVLCIP